MSKAILGLIALVAVGSYFLLQNDSNPNEQQFIQFVQEHRKSYFSKDEYNFRLNQFSLNLLEIEALNSQPNERARFAVNFFGDWTREERDQLLGIKVPFPEEEQKNTPYAKLQAINGLNERQDWRDKGKMSPVKNQQSCGSCWAFAATETIESRWAIEHGPVINLSEQEYVDCSRSFGNQGCNGGWYFWAWDYHKKVNGLATEDEYPYTALDGNCIANLGVRHANILSYNRVNANSESLKNILYSEPVSVAVDASNWSYYAGGTLVNCGQSINHAVVAIGFTDSDEWILRNSWGTKWGTEGGFIYLAAGNTCGVLNYLYKVNVAK